MTIANGIYSKYKINYKKNVFLFIQKIGNRAFLEILKKYENNHLYSIEIEKIINNKDEISLYFINDAKKLLALTILLRERPIDNARQIFALYNDIMLSSKTFKKDKTKEVGDFVKKYNLFNKNVRIRNCVASATPERKLNYWFELADKNISYNLEEGLQYKLDEYYDNKRLQQYANDLKSQHENTLPLITDQVIEKLLARNGGNLTITFCENNTKLSGIATIDKCKTFSTNDLCLTIDDNKIESMLYIREIEDDSGNIIYKNQFWDKDSAVQCDYEYMLFVCSTLGASAISGFMENLRQQNTRCDQAYKENIQNNILPKQ